MAYELAFRLTGESQDLNADLDRITTNARQADEAMEGLESSTTTSTRSIGRGTQVAQEFGFILNDMQQFSYGAGAGIRAISNNMPGLLFPLIGGGVWGIGIITALNLAATGFTLFGNNAQKAGEQLTEFEEQARSASEAVLQLEEMEFQPGPLTPQRLRTLRESLEGEIEFLQEQIRIQERIRGQTGVVGRSGETQLEIARELREQYGRLNDEELAEQRNRLQEYQQDLANVTSQLEKHNSVLRAARRQFGTLFQPSDVAFEQGPMELLGGSTSFQNFNFPDIEDLLTETERGLERVAGVEVDPGSALATLVRDQATNARIMATADALQGIPQPANSATRAIERLNSATGHLARGLESTFGGFGDLFYEMAAASEGANKQMFGAYKAFAISEAIVSTYLAANRALASAPPPFNYALASGVVASGLANVARIKSQSFGGGGAGGFAFQPTGTPRNRIPAGGGPPAPGPSAPAPRPTQGGGQWEQKSTISLPGGDLLVTLERAKRARDA